MMKNMELMSRGIVNKNCTLFKTRAYLNLGSFIVHGYVTKLNYSEGG